MKPFKPINPNDPPGLDEVVAWVGVFLASSYLLYRIVPVLVLEFLQ